MNIWSCLLMEVVEPPSLEFLGRQIYGYGSTNDPDDYPAKGVFYVPHGSIVDGRFVRAQTTTRPLALTPEDWRDVKHKERADYTKLWQEFCAAYGNPPIPPGAVRPSWASASPSSSPSSHGAGEDMPAPAMPVVALSQAHRVKLADSPLPFSALVARPVGKQEIARTPAAQAAMKVEWGRLHTKRVWDERVVREWDDVAREARQVGVEASLGYLFGICTEKNSEQPLGHPSRKFKGRVVFPGNRVVNQDWQQAIFEDLGNAPATMDAPPKIATGVHLATRLKWPMLNKPTSRQN
jgi:hypothetical protein